MVCGDTLEPADGNRSLVGSASPAGRFTGPVTHATQNTRKYVAFPILNISVGKITLGDLANVLRYIRVCRTGPLTVYNLVEIVWIIRIGGLHL